MANFAELGVAAADSLTVEENDDVTALFFSDFIGGVVSADVAETATSEDVETFERALVKRFRQRALDEGVKICDR